MLKHITELLDLRKCKYNIIVDDEDGASLVYEMKYKEGSYEIALDILERESSGHALFLSCNEIYEIEPSKRTKIKTFILDNTIDNIFGAGFGIKKRSNYVGFASSRFITKMKSKNGDTEKEERAYIGMLKYNFMDFNTLVEISIKNFIDKVEQGV